MGHGCSAEEGSAKPFPGHALRVMSEELWDFIQQQW